MRGAPCCPLIPHLSLPTPSFSLLLSFICLFLILACSSFISAAAGDLNSDAQALLAFKQGGGLKDNRNLISWTPSAIADICTTWFGVSCSNGSSSSATDIRIVGLRLPAKSLFGPIPLNSLGQLDAIETLSLRGNKFSGELPADLLQNCASLRRLYLQNNNFSGPLPDIPASWPLLIQADLSFNGFSGQIPPSLSNATRLKTLFLQNNSLSGSLPTINAPSLTSFSVANNQLSGAIPSSFSNFSAESFSGNGELCGYPLPNVCPNSTDVGIPSPSPNPNPRPNPNSGPNPNSSPNHSPTSLHASPPTQLPPTSRTPQHHKLSRKVIIGIAIGASSVALMAMSLLLCFIFRCHDNGSLSSSAPSSKKNQSDWNDAFMANSYYQGGGNGGPQPSPGPYKQKKIDQKATDQTGRNAKQLVFVDKRAKQMFDLEELLRASAEVLGKGSLGTAYKVMLDDGMVVVVKRLREVMCETEDFKQRMEVLGRLQHPNLVPITAYYFAKTEKLLVLDYMPEGSLSALLHGNKAKLPLNWEGRLSVAGTVAHAIAYLHSQKVVHGNLKSSNVLMANADEREEKTWRVADYGLVQLALFSPNSNVKLMGYIAPEISDMRSTTSKADVYSYGVLLLELLTGKSPILTAFDDHTLDLPKWVHASLLRDPHLIKAPLSSPSLFDPSLLKLDHFTHDDMIQLLHISLLCTSHTPSQRPSMNDVVSMIENLRKQSDQDTDVEDT